MNDNKIREDAELMSSLIQKAVRENRTAADLGRLCGRTRTWAMLVLAGKIRTVHSLTRAAIKRYLATPDSIQAPKKEQVHEILRAKMLGDKNPRWNNGNSQYPHHEVFKARRIERLRISKGKCEICGNPARVVHHWDGNKANHDIENLVALCKECHWALHTEDVQDLNLAEVAE